MTARGRYNDGRSAARKDVQVSLGPSALEIAHVDGTPVARWSLAALRLVDEPTDGVVRLGVEGEDARLVVEDAIFIRWLRTAAPALMQGRGPEHRWWRVAMATGAVAVPLVTALVLGLQWLVVAVAPFVPRTWEQPLGRAALAQIVRMHPRCEREDGQAALDKLVGRLRPGFPMDVPIDVQVVRGDVVNALALPGGTIVVFDGLLRRVRSPDEVAGVLAHEVAHVADRHTTAALLRVVGVSVIVRGVLGSSAGAQVGGGLLELSNTRAAEEEADRDGVALLRRVGVRPDGLALFFARLEREGLDADGLPTILSTHPPTAARRAAVRTGAGEDAGSAVLSIEEWRALRKICPRAGLRRYRAAGRATRP